MEEARGRVRVAKAHQQREDSVSQGCRTEFQHRDFQGRKHNQEAAASRLGTRGFMRHAYKGPVVQGGTDPPYE